MQSLKGQRVVVVGGSRGLGLGIVEAAVAEQAQVTVLARRAPDLEAVRTRLDVSIVQGDATDGELAQSVLRELRPSVLILTAGAVTPLARMDEQTWENFEAVWNVDVKSAFIWTQEALRLPLSSGARVLLSSSGAAIKGTPVSGGYAGAKRQVWFMAQYANYASKKKELGIHFQALIPRQTVRATGVGDNATAGHAREEGTTADHVFSRFGKPMSAADYGRMVVASLTQPEYAGASALGFSGDSGTVSMDPAPA